MIKIDLFHRMGSIIFVFCNFICPVRTQFITISDLTSNFQSDAVEFLDNFCTIEIMSN